MSFHRSLVLLLLGWATATAQQPAAAPPATVTPAPVSPSTVPPPPGVPVNPAAALPKPGAPGAVNPATLKPATPAAAPQAGIPLGENKIVEDIIEPKLSGNALAGLYRRYTGRRVIVSAGAATAEFSFVQEASPQDPLTYAKAAELLKMAATIENFVFVPHPNNPDIDVLTLATGGIRPPGIGVEVYNENDELPQGDAVISYVMTLDYIKPADAVNAFTQIIGQFGAYGSIASVENASAVIITENTSLIRKLIDLKKVIDKPGSVQATRWIPVQFADVTEIATTLTELLTAQQTTQKTGGIQRTDAAPAPGGAAPAGAQGGGGGTETPVQIIPEPRTNRVFAMGRPVDLLFVEGLVREFDIPSSEKTFLRRKLRFLKVSEFLPIAGDALTRAFSGTGEGGAAGGSSTAGGSSGGQNNRTQSSSRSSGGMGSSSRSSRTSGSSSSGFGGSSSGFGGSSSGFGGGGSSGFGGGGGGGGSALSAGDENFAPESVLVGRTLLVADNITNSVVAQGPPSALEIIERLLDQIDVKPDQVMISTVIGQLTLNKNMETGVDYLYRGTDYSGGAGGGFPAILPILKNVTGTGTGTDAVAAKLLDPGSFGGSGLTAIGRVDNLSVYLKALQSKTDFTVLSRPSIFTSNNRAGTISSGERIAIPTNSNSFSNGGASTNIEYQDVVLKLEVRPLVNSEKEITMEIALLNDEQNGNQVIQGAGNNGDDLTVPRISTREVITTATVPNNQTIVLGGLIVSKDNQEKSGIPILSDIPYLGRLFSTVTDAKDRSELMVFIQPSIVNTAQTLDAAQIDMDNRYKVSSRAHDFADGDNGGVLPGVNEISPNGKGGKTAPAAPAKTTGPSTMKPSIRPAHRQ